MRVRVRVSVNASVSVSEAVPSIESERGNRRETYVAVKLVLSERSTVASPVQASPFWL